MFTDWNLLTYMSSCFNPEGDLYKTIIICQGPVSFMLTLGWMEMK